MSAPTAAAGESTGVIARAFLANLGIAIAKFVAAAITGSSAMLTEGVHSLVDTTNEILLYHGQRRAQRPPDALHPAGYGREQYFWSFVVAELVFTLGAGVAFVEGIDHLRHPTPTESPLVALVVLGVALVLEGWSLAAAVRAFRRQGHGGSLVQEIRASRDTTTLSVLLEDAGAVVGLLLAAAGIGLGLYTGNPMWDGLASIGIGVLLACVALVLLVKAKHLLIGQTADPSIEQRIRALARGHEQDATIKDVLALQESVDGVISVVTIDFADGLSAAQVEQQCACIDVAIRSRMPQISRLYICPYYRNRCDAVAVPAPDQRNLANCSTSSGNS